MYLLINFISLSGTFPSEMEKKHENALRQSRQTDYLRQQSELNKTCGKLEGDSSFCSFTATKK
jgi:hypothetical protein